MRYKVLVVDDDPSVLKTVRQYLKEDYDVFAVNSGEAALGFFNKKTANLILMDVCMPGMNGQETMAKLKKRKDTANIPVIFLTADRDSQCEIRCFELGAADFIVKPFEAGVLRRRVAYHIRSYQNREQLMGMLDAERQKKREFREKVDQDGLTGLLNKIAFREEVARLMKDGISGAMLVMDVDNFKYINDTYGHLEGDRILLKIAALLREGSQANCLLSRFGGDEFVAFLPGVTAREMVSRWARELMTRIPRTVSLPDFSRKVTVSIGVALYPEQAENYLALFQRADSALLYMKEHGKGGYHAFDSEDDLTDEIRNHTEFTHETVENLLRRRKSEEFRKWVRFGEYRLLWYNALQIAEYYHIPIATVLFTVQPLEGGVLEQKQAEEVRNIIGAYFAEEPGRSIFTWYSANQLLMLLNWKEDMRKLIAKFLETMSQRIRRPQVQITYEVLRSDCVKKEAIL